MVSINLNVGSILPQLVQSSSVVSGKTALSIFDCVYLSNKGGVFCLCASDGETWVRINCGDIVVDGDIDFCVNAKSFVSALRNLSDADIRIEVDDEKSLMYCLYGKKGRFQLPIFKGSEFVLSSFNNSGLVDVMINPVHFLHAIQSADFAVANDELRPVMNGVHFDFNNDCLECASSDGQKLVHYVDSTVKSDCDSPIKGFTLPSKPSKIISQMLGGHVGGVRLSFNEECIKVDGGSWSVIARLCAGRYPNYKSVIPQSHPYHAIINKNIMLDVLNRLTPFGNDKLKLIKVELNNDEALLSSEDIDWSTSAQEAVECKYVGEHLQIGFKADSLFQVVKNIDCDDIIIDLLNASTAAVFRPLTDLDGTKYISILMPLIIG